jgi:threonine/homoserine/homoserine lactone efflux protein
MSVPIAELLPLAIGIAASITTIITMVLMLLSPDAKSRTAGLLVGCLVGVAGTVAVFALLASQLSTQEPGASPIVAAGTKTLIGVVLVVLALRQWRRREGSEPAELPKWMTGVDSMTTSKAFLLGLLLSAAVPKNLLLGVSAGIIVGEARFSTGRAAVVIAAFTAVAISTVAVPIAAHLMAPDRVRDPLQKLREWLVTNNRTIMVVALLSIGLYMIGNGITSF